MTKLLSCFVVSLAIFGLALTGCSEASDSTPTFDQEVVGPVEIASLDALLTAASADSSDVACLSTVGLGTTPVDPSPETVQALNSLARLVPVSECTLPTGDEWLVDDTGGPALLVTVDSVRVASRGAATAWGRWLRGPVKGASLVCAVDFSDRRWAAECEPVAFH